MHAWYEFFGGEVIVQDSKIRAPQKNASKILIWTFPITVASRREDFLRISFDTCTYTTLSTQ